MVRKEDLNLEQLKKRFTALVTDLESNIITADKPIPTKMQDIPALFEGWENKRFISSFKDRSRAPKDYNLDATKTIKAAVWIAKKYNLVPRDTPLRQAWYGFIKLSLQKSGNKIQNPDQMMSKAFSDIIKETDYYYSDFNIKNVPIGLKTPDIIEKTILFPNTLIAMEKASYYNYLVNIGDLLGLTIYSAGGQSQMTLAETVINEITNKFGDIPLDMYTITDYDPGGMNISGGVYDHIKLFLERKGVDFNHIRVAPKPEHYTPEELEAALYDASSTTQKNWNTAELIAEREKYDIPQKKGMEVESLPAAPLPEQMPSDMDIDEAIGQARMRLIIYDALLDKWGIEHPLNQYLDKYFYPSPDIEAETIIKGRARIDSLTSKAWDIYSKMSNLEDRLTDEFSDEIEELSDGIEQWRDDEREDWVENEERIDEFENELRTAVARDYTQDRLRYTITKPELPNEFVEWKLKNLDAKNKVNGFVEMLDGMIEKIDEEIAAYEES